MYIMGCNCILDDSQVKRVDNKLVCIEHGGRIIGSQGTCINDGTVFYRGVRGQLGHLCDDCVEKNRIAISRRKNARDKAERAERVALKAKKRAEKIAENKRLALIKSELKRADPEPIYDLRDHTNRGDYCACALVCRMDGALPKCLDCDKMIPIFRGVDPGRELCGV